MVEIIHKDLGVIMRVAEDRVQKYLAAGHKLAAPASEPATEEKPKRKRTTTKKK